MNSQVLPDHSAFLRLSESERIEFFNAAELWEAPESAILQYPGDAGEELLLVLEGRLETQDLNRDPPVADSAAAPRQIHALPGDFIGDNRLEHPRPVEQPLIAALDSRWLRWPRETLVSLFLSHRSLAQHLMPCYDKEGVLLSGLPGLGTLAGLGKKKVHRSMRVRRLIRGTLRPLWLILAAAALMAVFLMYLAGRHETLPSWIVFTPFVLFAVLALILLVKRSFREYIIDRDSISSKTLKLPQFVVESRHVPLDQVQGVETDRSGIINRLLGFGTLSVKTSALEGELRMVGINTPDSLRKTILDRLESVRLRRKGQDRESMRRAMEAGLSADSLSRSDTKAVPRLIRSSSLPPVKGGSHGDIRFPKSPAILIGRLVLPVLVCAVVILSGPLLPALISVSAGYAYLAALVPGIWALYRLEDWRNDIYLVSGGYAVDLDRKPLGIKETRRQVELASIQNIRTEQRGLLSFIFGYGDVILVSVGGASDLVFENACRPAHVQEELFRLREKELRRREDAGKRERLDELTRFAEAMDQIRR